MKKLTLKKITTAAVFTAIRFTAVAQQSNNKPAIDASDKSSKADKTATTAPPPQIVPAPKAMTVQAPPKPIVPGGEFKPVDTNVPVKNYAKTPDPQPNKKTAPAPGAFQKQ